MRLNLKATGQAQPRGWSIESAGWSVEYSEDDGLLSLNPADVEAALQFSAFRKAGGWTPEVLDDLSRQYSPLGSPRVAAKCGGFTGWRSRYSEEKRFWRKWWLANGTLHLFVTYNCDIDFQDYHLEVVDWM